MPTATPSAPKRGNQYSSSLFTLNPLDTRKAYGQILLRQGRPYREITARTGLSSATIAAMVKGEITVHPDVAEALKRVEEDKLTLGIHAVLDGTLTHEKIEQASLQQGVTSAAILIDKRELLAGRATSRVGQELTDDLLDAKIAEMRGQIVEVVPVVAPAIMTSYTHKITRKARR